MKTALKSTLAFPGRGPDRKPRVQRGSLATKLSRFEEIKAESASLEAAILTGSLNVVAEVRAKARMAAIKQEMHEIKRGQ